MAYELNKINVSTLPRAKKAIFRAQKQVMLHYTGLMMRCVGLPETGVDYTRIFLCIEHNDLIGAIKFYRQDTHCGLAEAKTVILLLAGSYD